MAVTNNTTNKTLISGTGSADSVINYGAEVTVSTGNDNDTVRNIWNEDEDDYYFDYEDNKICSGDLVSINTGAGNDSVHNKVGKYCTIDAEDGHDTVYNDRSDYTAINAGAGNDSISNYYSDYTTINAGAGNDLISLSSKYHDDEEDSKGNVIIYKEGDGNDKIYGFDRDDTLKIIGSSYSTTDSDYDVIIKVGEGKITLFGAYMPFDEDDNLILEEPETNTWTINGTTAAYGTSTDTLITVSGVKSADGLSLNGKVVTVAQSALGNADVTVSDGYTLALADDVSKPTTTKAAWTHDGTTATYKSAGTTAGYTLTDNSIIYSAAKAASNLATINGVKDSVNPAVKNGVITLKKANLSSNKVTVSGNGYEFNFDKGDYKKTAITGSANKDIITSRGNNLSIAGGKGNDTVKVLGNKTTITGGAGNDSISLSAAAKNNMIVYKSGDGNDIISGFDENDTLNITKGTAKVTTSGNDVIFTVGKGKITVKNAKDKKISYIDANGEQTYSDLNSKVSISGKTAKLSEEYLENYFFVSDFSDAVQTIDASAVTNDILIYGNKLANKIICGDGNDSLYGSTGNDTLTGGNGSDVFVYDAGEGNDTILDYKEEDIISIESGAASFKVDAKNIIITVGTGSNKGTITLKDAADKVVNYIEGGEEKTFGDTVSPVEVNGKTVTITENYTEDSFNLADYGANIQTIDASAVVHDISITANKLANKIIGSAENDTLNGGKGNDNLTGGEGSDVFVYNNGDGNDVITDYAEEDKIQIASGTIKSVKKSGSDVIFTVGKGKITVKNAAKKTVTYLDAGGKTNYYPTAPTEAVILTDSNTKAILRGTYIKDTFTASDYNASIKTIDASAVDHGIGITGNAKANTILGGYEDDTINGGKGNDILQGGSGGDTFLYANGDGNDIILDYEEDDTIKITKGGIKKVATSGDNVVFTIGSGKITVQNAANKTVSYIDASGKQKTYGSSASFIADNTNFELTPRNDLSSIVQSKAVDCSFVNTSTKLTRENNLITYSGSKK